mmetsp:Transcript_8042/g.15152  ORF Transcript_8042/g.15152 Transcript_8042/m.15152 type:complete len:221 (+) Transcript_8042:149-811(+)
MSDHIGVSSPLSPISVSNLSANAKRIFHRLTCWAVVAAGINSLMLMLMLQIHQQKVAAISKRADAEVKRMQLAAKEIVIEDRRSSLVAERQARMNALADARHMGVSMNIKTPLLTETLLSFFQAAATGTMPSSNGSADGIAEEKEHDDEIVREQTDDVLIVDSTSDDENVMSGGENGGCSDEESESHDDQLLVSGEMVAEEIVLEVTEKYQRDSGDDGSH